MFKKVWETFFNVAQNGHAVWGLLTTYLLAVITALVAVIHGAALMSNAEAMKETESTQTPKPQ